MSVGLPIGELTALLADWEKPEAFHRLIDLVYQDLHRMAKNYVRGPASGSYRPTMLVHDVYQRLNNHRTFLCENREHFFNCAGLIMRQLLTERARRTNSLKRGGAADHTTWEDGFSPNGQPLQPEVALALDKALGRLQALDARKYQVVAMRYFLGLSEEEIATALDVSVRTVRRDWLFCRTWLASEIEA